MNDRQKDLTSGLPETIQVEEAAVYTIKILGKLKPEWSEWFNGMEIISYEQRNLPVTLLTGRVADQSALRGILNRLWNLNLTVLAVICMGNPSPLEGGEQGPQDGCA